MSDRHTDQLTACFMLFWHQGFGKSTLSVAFLPVGTSTTVTCSPQYISVAASNDRPASVNDPLLSKTYASPSLPQQKPITRYFE